MRLIDRINFLDYPVTLPECDGEDIPHEPTN